MISLETCPRCSQFYQLLPEKMKPMVLSGCENEMQCDVCNKSFKLPDCEALRETARQQREIRYGKPAKHGSRKSSMPSL